ncbi:MAG: FAD-dependent oxidoreductase [Arthrobacter sp.]|nr:FAD-dependent oxidoreductase [Arthrobacter sp.]
MSAPQPASVLVIGGGPAGYTLVDQLGLRGYRGELTLVDPLGLPMDRPPLSKEFLRGAMSEEELRFREAEWFEERSITVIGSGVEEIAGVRLAEDAAGWEAFLLNGQRLVAEVVVLATGVAPAGAVPEGALSERVITQLYTVHDAARLRRALAPGTRLSIIGGGLVGAEAASVALGYGAEVTLVNPSDPAAVRSFGAVAAERLHALHAERGVRVETGRVARIEQPGGVGAAGAAGAEPSLLPVDAVGRADAGAGAGAGEAAGAGDGAVLGVGVVAGGEGQAVAPLRVVLEDGRSWGADYALYATGAVPRDDLARDAGAAVAALEDGGGVLVDASGRASLPNLWAVGDVARGVDADGAPLPLHAHWEAAMHSAEDAAAALMGQFPEERGARWFWSDRHGEHVEVVGHPGEVAGGRTVLRSDARGARGVFSVGAGGELLGAVTFDDARLARAARRLIDRGAPVDAEALADPEVSARDLVRPPRRD